MYKMFEQIFCFVAWVLGADLFKKYWPVRGSKWNDTHINPNSIADLESIIKEANGFTQHHLQITATFTLAVFLDWLFEVNYINPKYYFYVLIPMELYAFMIHYYNRIKATRRINLLKKDQPSSRQITVDIEPIFIKEINPNNTGFFYFSKCPTTYKPPICYLCELYGGRQSPLFESRERCEEFREFIYSKYSRDFIRLYNSVTTEVMKELHKEFYRDFSRR